MTKLNISRSHLSLCTSIVCIASTIFAQTQEGQLSNEQIVERAIPSVGLVLVGRTTGQTAVVGAAIVIRQHGILLTAYHLVKDAFAVQVRFKNGEIFDQVQLLGVDARRDVAAIRVTAAALPAISVAVASQAKSGDSIAVVSHPAALPWSASTGVVSAFRLADEVPGAGSGFRIIQFTAPSSAGSSGGVVLDSRGSALGLITGSLSAGQNLNFAVPLDSVLGLADTPAVKTFANGANLNAPVTVVAPNPSLPPPPSQTRTNDNSSGPTPEAPEKSDILSASKDRDFILRNFKTMYVECGRAQYFKSDQLKAELGRIKDFGKLNVRIVDDKKVADAVLEVGYTFAWDFPFELKHQNTTMVLLSGKGVGPFSGIAGAANVASQFVKLIKPYRIDPKQKK